MLDANLDAMMLDHHGPAWYEYRSLPRDFEIDSKIDLRPSPKS